jgi:hypothetical protein
MIGMQKLAGRAIKEEIERSFACGRECGNVLFRITLACGLDTKVASPSSTLAGTVNLLRNMVMSVTVIGVKELFRSCPEVDNQSTVFEPHNTCVT